MQITVHLDTTDANDLTALAALVAALGGRAPTVTNIVTPAAPTPAAPPPPPAARPETPQDAAEALMRHEANRVAGAAPPPPETGGDDGAVDPESLDADGIPWDVRIHSTPPKRNADQTWRKKRGLDEVTYGHVHAELQAAAGNLGTGTTTSLAAPNGSPTVETPPAPPPPASPDPTASVAPPPPPADAGNAPAQPSVNTAPPAAESAPGGGRFAGFPEFVQAVNSISTPTIPYLKLNEYAETVCGAGVQFKDLKDRPDAWETFYAVAGGQ